MVEDNIPFTNHQAVVMGLPSPGAYISIVFRTLHQQLKLVGTSTNQFGPV